jgi:methionyl-tRNA formyltransferase
MKVLFLAKEKPFTKDVADLITQHFLDADIIIGQADLEFPTKLLKQEFDYTISYLSPWIVPKKVLQNTKIAAINFHPGPPEYPGIGCTNFAIYNQEKKFGITVHYMHEKVDTGTIIQVKRFPLFEKDTVWSLSQRCYAYIYTTFVGLFKLMLCAEPFPVSDEKWRRKAYTRVELNELCRITSDMTSREIQRRIKATTFPNMPGAFVEIGGEKFEYRDVEN